MNSNEIEKRTFKWTINNSLPYVIATALFTTLLVFAYIPPLHYSIIMTILLVGVGLVDMKSIEIAGSSVDFEEEGE